MQQWIYPALVKQKNEKVKGLASVILLCREKGKAKKKLNDKEFRMDSSIATTFQWALPL